MSYILRPPQKIIFDKIRDCLARKNKKILVVAPTGFGKTALAYCIIEAANKIGNSVLFTSHRIDLAKQTKAKFKGLDADYFQGKNNDFNPDFKCLVATIQTLQKHEIKQPKIVIIDEVHYAYESKLIQDLFKRFPNSIFICLTATPTDNAGYLLDGFDAVVQDYQTKDLIDLGWLVPMKCYAPMTIDVSEVKRKGQDFDSEDLEKTINKEDINLSIYENYKKFADGRKFIIFASNKNHCESLKKTFKCSEIISADVPEKKREQILSDFKIGKIKGLISIEILTAGFDEESLSCVIFATATMQWKKYIQCIGRGLRLFGQSIEESISNGKSDCIVLDFCGNIERHDLPDVHKVFELKAKFSRIVDRQLGINEDVEESQRVFKEISEEKKVYLKQIGSMLDLYDGKVYLKESDLQEDVNNFLKKTNFYGWRQNSGKMFKDGRWIHFASKNGLPDNAVYYKNSSIYFGLELKLPKGRLTDYQKQTLPEFILNNVLFFICESVFDVFLAICHIEENIIDNENFLVMDKKIYDYPDWQKQLRSNLKLI
jgi:superfamily II DNA or RNA helicase